ncbi:MAG TPA: RidA family protein [Haliangiales bacterium]|nr:RidA family protein [Haliangiales bacterium]
MERIHISGGATWEPIIGYSRLVRVGPHVWVTGTTSFLPGGGHVGDGDAYAQAKQIFANIATALAQVGASLDHVVRTRMYLTDIARDWQAVGRAHGEAVGRVRPAATMVEVTRLLEEWMIVEIEVDAYVD